MSPTPWFAGEGESLLPSGKANAVAAASMKDGSVVTALAGHGLHIAASATDANICSVSAERTTPRRSIWANMVQILYLFTPARPPEFQRGGSAAFLD